MKQLILSSYLLLVGTICFVQPATPIDYTSLFRICDSLNSLNKTALLGNGMLKKLQE